MKSLDFRLHGNVHYAVGSLAPEQYFRRNDENGDRLELKSHSYVLHYFRRQA